MAGTDLNTYPARTALEGLGYSTELRVHSVEVPARGQVWTCVATSLDGDAEVQNSFLADDLTVAHLRGDGDAWLWQNLARRWDTVLAEAQRVAEVTGVPRG